MTHYFLGSRLLGSSPLKAFWQEAQPIAASIAYICPTCGDLWARVAQPTGEWMPLRAGCREHPYLHPVGGSFIPPWRHTFTEFPQAVLEYEFDIHFNHYQRTQNAKANDPR